MSLSFYIFFCTYLFFLYPYLISHTNLLSLFYFFFFFLNTELLLLPFKVTVDHLLSQTSFSFSFNGQTIYPPQARISTTRITRIKTHKHRLHQPTSIQTHFHRPTNSNLAPLAPIHQSTNPQATNTNTNLSLLVCLCGCVCVSMLIYLCGCVYV